MFNLNPPFGKLFISVQHILQILFWVNRIGQCGNDINDNEPPFVVVNGFSDFLLFEQSNLGDGFHDIIFSNGMEKSIETDIKNPAVKIFNYI